MLERKFNATSREELLVWNVSIVNSEDYHSDIERFIDVADYNVWSINDTTLE